VPLAVVEWPVSREFFTALRTPSNSWLRVGSPVTGCATLFGSGFSRRPLRWERR